MAKDEKSMYIKPQQRLADLKGEYMEKKQRVVDKTMVDELIVRTEKLCPRVSK